VGQARAEVLENVVGARSIEFLRSANAGVFAVRAPVRAAVGAAEALPGVEYAEESRRGSSSSARAIPSTIAVSSGD
jgi:hypothetical protein